MKIICVGRNYIDHIYELDNPKPSEPVFFLKPDSSVLKKNQPFSTYFDYFQHHLVKQY